MSQDELKASVFSIPRMDCPSEEHIVRIALEHLKNVKKLSFDLPNRRLTTIHYEEPSVILDALSPLGLGANLEFTSKADPLTTIQADEESVTAGTETTALKIALVINSVMFLVELVAGYIAESTGLLSDSLDMFADSAVFAMSLYAVGRSFAIKRSAARLSGFLQLLLALGAFIEVARRFFEGSEPHSSLMISIAAVALIANAACMWILARHRNGGVHMRASWIFLTNDVIANMGVILAGVLVWYTGSHLPDLFTGAVIAVIVFSGAVRILRAAK